MIDKDDFERAYDQVEALQAEVERLTREIAKTDLYWCEQVMMSYGRDCVCIDHVECVVCKAKKVLAKMKGVFSDGGADDE